MQDYRLQLIMPWYLKSGADIVAELGPELERPDSHTRAWPVRPTAQFELVRPAIAAMEAMHHAPMPTIPEAIKGIPDERERALAIQSWIRTNPQAQDGTRASEQIRGLGLRIADESGVPLPCTVMITQVPPASIPFSDDMRSDFEKLGYQGGPPFFMAVAVVTPPREDKV